MHQHYFYGATATLPVAVGDTLFAYVYLDPANPPSEVMLQWNDGSWEHRAYWGSNQLTAWGVDGTASRRYMGVLPPLGQWVKLSVPAASVGLEGRTLSGMAFTLFGGRATFDYAGKTSAGATTYQLSGTVTQGGSALNGVVIAATNGVTCSSSDAAGRYACTVPQGWSGTVTPSKAGYTFTPASRTYSAVGADRTTENYAAAASAQTVLRKVRDFNGDGRDDILWRNTSTEQSAVWTMNGLAGSGAALYAVFPYLMRWTGDFDGDGKTDILFRSNQFGGLGEIAAWLMNGTAPAGSTVLLANPDWIPTHVADLDGDGKDDIVWRQGSTNNVAVWLMNGLAIKSSAVILAGQPNWQVE
ncbi:MAG TPA: VCBS repeat-containing protein, partial [Ilumatobacteraceae bacterium]|nr:VCBS repeat-containing protein [Ilumatobacteraceae bacterium]